MVKVGTMEEKARIKLRLLAGKAAPSPLLGQAFGQYGINIASFCSSYNAMTKNINGTYLPTIVTIYDSNSFDIKVRTPSTSMLLKKIGKFKKGSHMPKKQNLNSHYILVSELFHLATLKKCDSLSLSLKSICKNIMGSAKSMGLPVVVERVIEIEKKKTNV
jgi:large subunit ribosomal protein L11